MKRETMSGMGYGPGGCQPGKGAKKALWLSGGVSISTEAWQMRWPQTQFSAFQGSVAVLIKRTEGDVYPNLLTPTPIFRSMSLSPDMSLKLGISGLLHKRNGESFLDLNVSMGQLQVPNRDSSNTETCQFAHSIKSIRVLSLHAIRESQS
jgi:hypothetical protein